VQETGVGGLNFYLIYSQVVVVSFFLVKWLNSVEGALQATTSMLLNISVWLHFNRSYASIENSSALLVFLWATNLRKWSRRKWSLFTLFILKPVSPSKTDLITDCRVLTDFAHSNSLSSHLSLRMAQLVWGPLWTNLIFLVLPLL
jgi:hypothetical protein